MWKWSAESHLYQVRCIDNDFVAENCVGIQQRSIEKCLDIYQKHIFESGTQTTQGNNYIFFRRLMFINKFQFVLLHEFSFCGNHHP